MISHDHFSEKKQKNKTAKYKTISWKKNKGIVKKGNYHGNNFNICV